VAPIETREIYAAPDWLDERQERVEKRLARKHLSEGTLVLYDVSSSYLEGRAVASWPSSATAATSGATGRRSSTD
jgi:hypothetical protein